MPGGHFDRVRDMFADQFEPDSQGFIYRKYMKGAPIQVSAAERDRYIATFNKFYKYGSWAIGGGTIALIVSLAFYETATGIDLSDIAIYAGFSVVFVSFMGGYYWAWNLPARELRGRGTLGEARSRAEIKRLFLAKLTYGQLAAGAGTGVVLLLKAHANGDMFAGWNILWTCLAAAIFILSGVQTFRKWRFESQQR